MFHIFGFAHASCIHHGCAVDPKFVLLLVVEVFPLVPKFNVCISVGLGTFRTILVVVGRVMSIILGHVHVCILLFEIKLPFLLGLFHSGLLVDSGEGDRAFFGTENELRNSVVLQAVTPLSPTAQLVLFILRQHHVNHLVVELQVLLLEANNAQEFCLGVCELLDQVLILRILLVVLAL